METIILNSNPTIIMEVWNTLKGLNPYWLSFINTLPQAFATVIVSFIVTKLIMRRFEKEDKKLDKIQDKQNDLEIRLIKLEERKK